MVRPNTEPVLARGPVKYQESPPYLLPHPFSRRGEFRRLSWLIRASGLIGCAGAPPINHKARINHANGTGVAGEGDEHRRFLTDALGSRVPVRGVWLPAPPPRSGCHMLRDHRRITAPRGSQGEARPRSPIRPAGPIRPTRVGRRPRPQRHRCSIGAAQTTPMFHRRCSECTGGPRPAKLCSTKFIVASMAGRTSAELARSALSGHVRHKPQ
jgi:hypothetical protein